MNALRYIGAWLFGKRLVVLEDYDGTVHLRIERVDVLGRPMAKRHPYNIRNVVLNDDGTIGGACYVTKWHLVADYSRKVGAA